MHDLVWGKVHSLALLLMSRALSFPLRAKKACRTRIGCRVCGRKLAAEPGELGGEGCTVYSRGREASLERDPSGGGRPKL